MWGSGSTWAIHFPREKGGSPSQVSRDSKNMFKFGHHETLVCLEDKLHNPDVKESMKLQNVLTATFNGAQKSPFTLECAWHS